MELLGSPGCGSWSSAALEAEPRVDDLSRSPALLRRGEDGFDVFESFRIKCGPGAAKVMDALAKGFFGFLEGDGNGEDDG